MNIGFILDYIYHGEVNIYQEHLDSFLESAQELEISGLIGGIEESNETKDGDLSFRKNQSHVPKLNYMSKEEEVLISDDTGSSLVTTTGSDVVKQRRQYSRAPANDGTLIFVGNMTQEEIKIKTKELYQKIDGGWSCLHCGKISSHKSSGMRYHVETHMDGLCYTCNVCSKEFRSKNAYNFHKSRYHQ